jgi:hypothetical protein
LGRDGRGGKVKRIKERRSKDNRKEAERRGYERRIEGGEEEKRV